MKGANYVLWGTSDYGAVYELTTTRWIVTDEPRIYSDLTFEKRDSITKTLLEGVAVSRTGPKKAAVPCERGGESPGRRSGTRP